MKCESENICGPSAFKFQVEFLSVYINMDANIFVCVCVYVHVYGHTHINVPNL